MFLALTLLLATTFPSSNKTAWMQPQSFHLSIGMNRAEVLRTLERDGWKAQKGEKDGELFVDYTPTQSLTLHFQKNRLHSIRFELFTALREIGHAFEEEKAFLKKAYGAPKTVPTPTLLVYDNLLPNIMAVVSNDPKSDNGRKGLGMLVVRYYDPAVPAVAAVKE